MAKISGISFDVAVGGAPGSRSMDQLYIGVYGKHGGREFALDRSSSNPELGADGLIRRFYFGNGCCRKATDLLIDQSSGAQWNGPGVDNIDLDHVEYVYVRKMSRLQETGSALIADDVLVLTNAVVTLCDSSGNMRRFSKRGIIPFGHQYGHQHWLIEGARPGCNYRIELNTVTYSGTDIGEEVDYRFIGSLNVDGVDRGTAELARYWSANAPFGPGEVHNYGTGASFGYFRPGCCGGAGLVSFYAEVTEYDFPDPDDTRIETHSIEISCGDPPKPFSIVVRVNESGGEGVFTFAGTVYATCVG